MFSATQKKQALDLYDQFKSITKVILLLGYPSRQALYQWIALRDEPPKQKSAYLGKNTPDHPRHPSIEIKLTTLHRCFELGEDTDRGCHYRWPGWILRMEAAGLQRSMSRKGCSPDNSACEGLFGRLKNEMFYNRDWKGVSTHQFIQILNDYLILYNEKRIKVSLGNMSPLEYRRSLGIAA